MAYLQDFIQRVISEGTAKKTSHEASVGELLSKISDAEKTIADDYAKIGELYVKQHPDDAEGELGAMVQEVKAAEKTIKDSKLEIASTLGFNFCPVCFQEVDDDALFCNNCGAKMPVKQVCPNCGATKVEAGVAFCDECGRRMEPAE